MLRQRRRVPRNSNVTRAVTRKIKQLELNHAPKWIRSRSLNQDPTPYSATVPITRKLRFVGKTSATVSAELTTADIAGVIPNDTGYTIERIKIYGPGSSDMLQVNIDHINTLSSQTFDDYGTPGHQRQYIDVFFPRTGLIPISQPGASSQRILIDLLNSASTRVVGDVIVDLWLTVNWNIPVSTFT